MQLVLRVILMKVKNKEEKLDPYKIEEVGRYEYGEPHALSCRSP